LALFALLAVAAEVVAAVCPPLSPGGRADLGGGAPPPRAAAVRRPDRPRDRVERRSRRPAGLCSPLQRRAGRAAPPRPPARRQAVPHRSGLRGSAPVRLPAAAG